VEKRRKVNKMVWKCQNPDCNAENDDKEEFCINCGLKKGSGQQVQQEQQTPVPAPAPITPPPDVTASPAGAPEAQLQLVKSSISIASEFSVTNGKTLGRTMENDIIVPDSYVSRKHAKITYEGGGYLIEDVGSTNGTLLNGNEIKGLGKQALKDGDQIQLGTTLFKFKSA
jgi:pSer/pThr/pTyr-binding forkhead associated (FHA) protein